MLSWLAERASSDRGTCVWWELNRSVSVARSGEKAVI